MRRLFFATGLVLLLAGCGSSVLSYRLTYDTQDAARKTELSQAAERVLGRRLIGLKQDNVQPSDIKISADENTVEVHAASAAIANELTRQLTQPFTMSIMIQTESGASADLSNPKFGSFDQTGITEKDFDWVKAGNSGTMKGKGAVLLTFTKDGGVKLQEIFSANRGKTIGVFVRGLLMSRKVVTPQDTQESILVDGVPSAELASVFADDVNVGLHVKFAPGK
jgi:hypothetical protein